jgi:hypothetical protein
LDHGPSDRLQQLLCATNGGWPLGDAPFKRRLAKALGRRMTPREAGRPPKPRGDTRQMKLL